MLDIEQEEEAYQTGREAIYDVCQSILEYGSEVSPRGMKTREVLGCAFRINHSWDVLPTGINRPKLLPAIGAAEALQNIAGYATPELMHRISSFFPKPTSRWDAGVPTYGERIGPQLPILVELLQKDPDSRQAVAMVLEPEDPSSGQMHNLCAIALQFMIRDGKLVTFAHMRSNDAWYGLCYDLFMFAQVGISIANALNLEPGPYFHTANSMHLYERHWDVAENLFKPASMRGAKTPDKQTLLGIGRPGDDWSTIIGRADELLHGENLVHPTDTELWYREQLEPYAPDGK
jgi:thymidylate synthase